MSSQSESKTELTLCPSCGAAVAILESTCWLCKADLTEEIVTAEVVAEPPQTLKPTASRVALIIGMVVFGLATVGVVAVAPGVGVLLGIVFVIAVFGVTKGLQDPGPVYSGDIDRQAIAAAYSAPAAGETASTGVSVVAQVFKVLGIILLVGLASIIAFFTFCVLCVIVVTNM